MDRYGSSAGGMGGAGTPSKKELIQQLQQQVQMAQLQELVQRTAATCFDICITKPGKSLSGSDQDCLGKCMDRFLETTNFVSQTYAARLQKQFGGAQ